MLVKKFAFFMLFISTITLASTQSIYNQKCGICHGIDGSKLVMGKSKEIRGMTVEDIEKAIEDYATKKRYSNVMIQSIKKDFLNSNSKEVLHNIAVYINKL